MYLFVSGFEPMAFMFLGESNTLALILLFMLPRFGMTFLIDCRLQEKVQNLPVLQKPIRNSLSATHVSPWYNPELLDLQLLSLVLFSCVIESVH